MHWDALKWTYESNFPETVKGSAHAVLVALAYSMHPETKRCNPSLDRLCSLTHLESGAVKSALRILKKENLIALSSGKRKRISNDYVINFSTIPKKAKSNSVPATKTKSNSAPATKTNATSSPDSVISTQSSTTTQPPTISISAIMDSYTATISYHKRFDNAPAPFNSKKAFAVTMAYFNNQTWYIKGGMKIWEDWIPSIQRIAEFMAFITDPTIEDVGNILNRMNTQQHWDALKKATEILRERYEVGSDIKNWRSYSLTILKNDLSDCDNPPN